MLLFVPILYFWDISTTVWIEQYKEERTYDINSNETSYITYNWDISTAAWLENSKQEWAYDINNNIILMTFYNWDISIGWEESVRYEINYDIG